jgi:hypothetical protein
MASHGVTASARSIGHELGTRQVTPLSAEDIQRVVEKSRRRCREHTAVDTMTVTLLPQLNHDDHCLIRSGGHAWHSLSAPGERLPASTSKPRYASWLSHSSSRTPARALMSARHGSWKQSLRTVEAARTPGGVANPWDQ